MATHDDGSASLPPARARILSAFALVGLLSAVAYLGHQGYRVATDAFVAPIIFSPDSEPVLAAKLRASQLSVERARTSSEIDEIDRTVEAGDRALARLRALQKTPVRALDWTSALNKRQVVATVTEERMLRDEKELLEAMAAKQLVIVSAEQSNVDAGLSSRLGLIKELKVQDELQLALIENRRTRLHTGLRQEQVTMSERSISGTAPAMPEVLARDEQLIRIELEILHVESEQRGKGAERKVLADKLATLEELEAQIKSRPMFRATEKSMDAAFVPYTQSAEIRGGASVYRCVWGVFNCAKVGEVTEVVAGEVVLPDPWGNQARGQYVVLQLNDRESAKAKTLRVRSSSPSPGAARLRSPEALSER